MDAVTRSDNKDDDVQSPHSIDEIRGFTHNMMIPDFSGYH